MKKFIICLLCVVTFVIGYGAMTPASQHTLHLQDASIYSGHLIVVNRDIPLMQSPSELVPIASPLLTTEREHLVVPHVHDALQQLLEDASAEGIEGFTLSSAYRTSKEQQALYKRYGADYALPATYSEHETGLAIDVGTIAGNMDTNPTGEWFITHAPRYGFILRYPADKVDVTQIAYEPWHYRYVGLPHSVMMTEKNLALEEYIRFIQNKSPYKVKQYGESYIIYYVDANADSFNIQGNVIDISGDNTQGFIVTTRID